ncbi:MAG: two-component sensor histidine kinase, partial [Burkholderiales bacterium]|nr:two-component sensor histidine kinase [Burkholderiales bacterium]
RTLASAAADADPESRLVVQFVPGPAGTGALVLPEPLAPGLQTLRVGRGTYRVFVASLADGRRLAVAQDTQVRDEIARDAAWRAVLPLLLLAPLLLLIVAVLVGRAFAPVVRLAGEVHARSDRELHALEARRLPTEILPFVDAINRLLAKVERAMQAQRRFVADAAHELRSPMTALSLQAERLEAAGMSAPARERLGALRQSIERARRLLDQLLGLARAQGGGVDAAAAVSVAAVFRLVLEDMLPLAQARRIDIGIDEACEAWVQGAEFDLVAIVRNLVDNAVRYGGEGARVDLRVREVQEGWVAIEVDDDGAGVAPAERERLLDPFYRVLGSGETGSGLGLSIVAAVVERLGGRIELRDSERFGHGLLVRVLLPRAPAGVR